MSREWDFRLSNSVDDLQEVGNRVCWFKLAEIGLFETKAGAISGIMGRFVGHKVRLNLRAPKPAGRLKHLCWVVS